jgi:hypothetical protein
MYRHSRSIDPQELAARFSEDAVLEVPDSVYDLEWKQEHLLKVLSLLGGLPPMEADIVRLYFFFGKRQTDIAEIFGFTQAAISYRLKRAIVRLRFLLDMPDIDVGVMRRDLQQVLSSQDADIFVQMASSTCQSEVASVLRISQGMVRHRFLKRLRVVSVAALDRVYPWAFSSAYDDPDHAVKKPLRELWEAAYEARNSVEPEAAALFMRLFSCFLDLATHVRDQQDTKEGGELVRSGVKAGSLPYPEAAVRWVQYCRLFYQIKQNYNILHEVKLPQWSDRPELVLF